MKASEITNLTMEQFNRLNESELQSALKTMQKAVNQRVRRVEASGAYSPALQSLEKSGGGISAKKGSRAAMQSELSRAIGFMKMKTSTVPGAKAHHRQVLADLNLPPDTSKQDITEAWNEYNRLKEEFSAELLNQIFGSQYANAAHNIVKQLAQGVDAETIRQQLEQQYEQFASQQDAELERIANGF